MKRTLYDELAKHDYDIEPSETVVNIKQRYKELNKYVKISDLTKQDLINEIGAISHYINNKNDRYDEFKFGDNVIKLDNEQQKIVTAPCYNHVRIIACAGSGKTTTILCRIKYLLENITTPEKILLMTFNKDACENLKNRMRDLFGFNIKIEIRTIDSFSAKIYYSNRDNMKENNFLSISEYCTLALELLKKHGDVICNKYDYLFFDEFQDISNIQFEMLRVFALNKCYLTVIGDDNQNIYQWRGSNNYYMINFDQIFTNTDTYTIINNYRSTQHIIELANASINNNINQIKKHMNAVKICHENIKPELQLFSDSTAEYKYIVDTIEYMMDKHQYNYHDFAVLARTSSYLKEFETFVSKYNIKKGKNIKYIALLTEETDNKPVIITDHVAISTIHRSKGLEWQVVFIIGICNCDFPSALNKSEHNIEEERRLFYVAVTRAKKYLLLLSNTKHFLLATLLTTPAIS